MLFRGRFWFDYDGPTSRNCLFLARTRRRLLPTMRESWKCHSIIVGVPRVLFISHFDERLKVKSEESTRPRIHRVVWGTGTPQDKDEVKRREVGHECDG